MLSPEFHSRKFSEATLENHSFFILNQILIAPAEGGSFSHYLHFLFPSQSNFGQWPCPHLFVLVEMRHGWVISQNHNAHIENVCLAQLVSCAGHATWIISFRPLHHVTFSSGPTIIFGGDGAEGIIWQV